MNYVFFKNPRLLACNLHSKTFCSMSVFSNSCSFKPPLTKKKRKLGTKIRSSLSLFKFFHLPHKSSELKQRHGDILPQANEIQYTILFGGFFGLRRWQFAGASERLASV